MASFYLTLTLFVPLFSVTVKQLKRYWESRKDFERWESLCF